jgi:hypothetical protein
VELKTYKLTQRVDGLIRLFNDVISYSKGLHYYKEVQKLQSQLDTAVSKYKLAQRKLIALGVDESPLYIVPCPKRLVPKMSRSSSEADLPGSRV